MVRLYQLEEREQLLPFFYSVIVELTVNQEDLSLKISNPLNIKS